MSCANATLAVLMTEQMERGPVGVRFNEQGMILPHSILGSLEDYRSYLEAKGETELVKRIPKSPGDSSCEATERRHPDAVETPSGQGSIQGHALQNWDKHMRQRRRQQGSLSDLLHRPVKNLLMNQACHFRETQEQREFLSQVMPLIHSGYGYRVGSEFWSLPQRYGDETSGITATLTQTEQGRRKTITQIGQPWSICQESGIVYAETLRPTSRAWSRSAYLQHQRQQLTEVLQDMDIKKPDIGELEVIGSGKPFHSTLLEKEEEEEEMENKQNLDPVAQHEDAQLEVPALRFCGQLATWTGNSLSKQEEVGITAAIFFESLTGEIATSHVDLHNEGSTVIFYSWQRLPVQDSFPNLHSHAQKPHFYFDSSSGVILPSDTQRVEFVFKSDEPGIKTEIWQFNSHPVLLQGASVRVTLRGVSLYQDKTADERLFIETKLEKIVREKICRSIVCEVVRRIRSPERPSSPAELYFTPQQWFLSKNPKLQYHDEPVEGLKTLWQKLDQGSTWDYSVDTLRPALLSLPEEASSQDSLRREEGLAQLNSLYLQLSEHPGMKHHLTAATIGRQLWRKVLDTMSAEATQIKNLLGCSERETWMDKEDEPVITDADLAENVNKEVKSDKKESAAAIEEKSGARPKLKKDPLPTAKKTVEDKKKKGKREKDTEKHTREKQENESESIPQLPPNQTNAMTMMPIYRRLLHRKVYALVEDLIDSLCDLMDELHEEDKRETFPN